MKEQIETEYDIEENMRFLVDVSLEIGGKRKTDLVAMIYCNMVRRYRLSCQGIFSARIRIGKYISELGNIIEEAVIINGQYITRDEIFTLSSLCEKYLHDVRLCTNHLITDQVEKIKYYREFADDCIYHLLLKDYRERHHVGEITEEKVEAFLTKSNDYSRKMMAVVSRDGNGSSPDHYKIHGPFLQKDVDYESAVKEAFEDWEEFLDDEDGKFVEQHLHEVTVREVRLGKVVSTMTIVDEPVYRMVKKG